MEEENRTEGYLHEAVRTGNFGRVCDIIESDSSCVNDYNLDFKTPLHLVYESNYPHKRLRIMQLLIDYGADVNIRGKFTSSPLSLAIKKRHINGIKLLLQSGADPAWATDEMIDQLKQTPLNVIKILIEHMNLDSNVIKYKNGMLLDMSIYFRDFDLVQMLVHLGVKNTNIYKSLLELCDVSSSTLVLLQRLIEYLLSHATKVDSHGHFTPKALKCYMVTYHHDEGHLDKCSLKKYLREQGIDDDDDLGESDLHRAVRNGDKELVQSLLEKGSNVNARNNFGDTPLHLLFAVNEPIREEWVFDIAKLLIEYGADLRAHNFLDETPFFKAVEMSYDMKLINFMLNKIAGVRISESLSFDSFSTINNIVYYLTAGHDESVPNLHELIIAIALTNEQLVDRLLEIDRMNLESKNQSSDVNTALFAAVNKGNYAMVKMLLKAGIRTNRNSEKVFLGQLSLMSDMRIPCLLWEFRDNLMMCTIMEEVFFFFITCERIGRITYLLTFYYAINLRLNNLDSVFIPLKGLFKLHSGLSIMLTSCNSKLNELKKEKIGRISIFGLLTMELDSLVKLLNNTYYFYACKEFLLSLGDENDLNYYQYAIKTRLDLAIEKRQLMDVAKKCLNWALQDILIPMRMYMLHHHITWKILSFLTMRDLERVAKNYEKNKKTVKIQVKKTICSTCKKSCRTNKGKSTETHKSFCKACGSSWTTSCRKYAFFCRNASRQICLSNHAESL